MVKYTDDLLKAGFNGPIKVTPVTVGATTRVEVPAVGVAAQLKDRKAVLIQNTSAVSGTLWVGAQNVGFSGTGAVNEATCSGLKLMSGESVILNVGRARLYVYNQEGFPVTVKLLEMS